MQVLHIALIPSKEAQYDIAPCLACDGNRKKCDDSDGATLSSDISHNM